MYKSMNSTVASQIAGLPTRTHLIFVGMESLTLAQAAPVTTIRPVTLVRRQPVDVELA